MRNSFVALNVPVLNFSREPDQSGSIIPPEAHVTHPDVVQVTYGEEDLPVGVAKLRRHGNQLLADMTIHSTMQDPVKALRMMRKLYPATAFNVIQFHKNIVLELNITEVFLTPAGNHDATIQPLGERVHPRKLPKDMH